MHSHQMQSPADVLEFALAGNATLTLVSKRTGTRFTYKIRQPEPDKPHFISLLTAPDNEKGFTFFATRFSNGELRHGARSRLMHDAPAATAFRWFWKHLIERDELHPQLEVWHEGRCGRCGRKLTVPESIENGLGPECIKRRKSHEPGRSDQD